VFALGCSYPARCASADARGALPAVPSWAARPSKRDFFFIFFFTYIIESILTIQSTTNDMIRDRLITSIPLSN
jgi:hypothetical protein